MLERIFELSLVSTSIFHRKNSKPFNSIFFPLAYITFAFRTCPHSRTCLFPELPLSVINLSVAPFKYSSTMSDSFFKLSFITWAIRMNLISQPMFEVIEHVSFIDLTRKIKNCSLSMFFSFRRELAEIDTILIFFDLKIWGAKGSKKRAFWVIKFMNPVNFLCSKGLLNRMDCFVDRLDLSYFNFMKRRHLNQLTFLFKISLYNFFLFFIHFRGYWFVYYSFGFNWIKSWQSGSSASHSAASDLVFSIPAFGSRIGLLRVLREHGAIFFIWDLLNRRGYFVSIKNLAILV